MQSRPAPAIRPPEFAGGAIKSILFAVHDDSELDSHLQAALSLASMLAHVQLLHVVPVQAYPRRTFMAGSSSAAKLSSVEEEAGKIRERLEQHLKFEDVSWNTS